MKTKYWDMETGDLVLVQSSSWLSRAIQWWMKVYRKLRGYSKGPLLNHAGVVIQLWGKLFVAESTGKGVRAKYSVDEYIKKHKVIIRRFKRPLSPAEKIRISKLAISFATIPHRYDFFNFIHQMVMIVTGKWIGPTKKKAMKRVYCSEFAAILLDSVRDIFKGHTWDKNPEDLLHLRGMKTIFNNL